MNLRSSRQTRDRDCNIYIHYPGTSFRISRAFWYSKHSIIVITFTILRNRDAFSQHGFYRVAFPWVFCSIYSKYKMRNFQTRTNDRELCEGCRGEFLKPCVGSSMFPGGGGHSGKSAFFFFMCLQRAPYYMSVCKSIKKSV